jgi:hypothetical protein
VYQDQLVAVMSFSQPRRAAGSSKHDLELVRFAVDGHIPGIGSRIFAHATRLLGPQCVVSYSDNEYSNGGVYRSLGFSLSHELSPSYWYWCPKKKKQYHRYNFTKHSLLRAGYDEYKTEKEIMAELGYLRIWDAGKQVWVWQS